MSALRPLLFTAFISFSLGALAAVIWASRTLVIPRTPALEESAATIAELQGRIDELEARLERAEQPGTPTERVVLADDPVKQAELSEALTWLSRLSPDQFGNWSIDRLQIATELDLSGLVLDAEDLLHLQALDSLTSLNLARTSITDLELASLAGLDLQSLDLTATLITDAGLLHLAEMGGLQELALDRTEIGDEGIARLLHLSGLRSLGLDGTGITDAGLQSLASLDLDTLRIGQTRISDAGLATLDNFRLRELSLYRNTGITDAGLMHLHDQTALETLNLRGANITAAGLANLNDLGSLKELNASLVMDDAGMVHLQGLDSIERLGLYSNPEITDAGIAYLQNLTTLQELQLQFTKIGDRGLGFLQNLTNLRMLDLRGTDVSPAAVESFRLSHPNCRVIHQQ